MVRKSEELKTSEPKPVPEKGSARSSVLHSSWQEKQQKCLSTQEIEFRLQKAGVNPTAQRIAICRYVLCEARHPTAEQVKDWADQNFPKLSLATVYNTLKTLVDAGLLREYKLAHSESSIYDNNVSPHHHFLDEATGELTDISAEELEVKLKLKKGFKVKDMEILLIGTRS